MGAQGCFGKSESSQKQRACAGGTNLLENHQEMIGYTLSEDVPATLGTRMHAGPSRRYRLIVLGHLFMDKPSGMS